MMKQQAERVYNLPWIVGHWRTYAGVIPVLLVLTVIYAAASVAMPYFLQRVIDGLAESLSVDEIWRNVGWLLLFGVLQGAVYFTLMTLRARANLSLDLSVRLRAFETILRMSSGFFQRFRVGDMVTRLTDDVSEKLAWFLCSGLFRTFEAILVITFGVIMMVRIDLELTLWAAGPLPILIGLFVITANKLERRYKTVQAAISSINDRLESVFAGIRVIKAFSVEDAQIKNVDRDVANQKAAELKAVRMQSIIDSLYGHIWQLAIVGVLLIGGVRVIEGEITLGELVAFDAYILLLVWPMFDLGQFLVRGRVSAVSIGRIRELEEAKPDIDEGWPGLPKAIKPSDPIVTPLARRTGVDDLDIELKNVTFRYGPEGRDVLRDVSLQVRPGEMTAVVGQVGSGKSTLLNLIPALEGPRSGAVFVGGRDIRNWDLPTLRQSIGYVPQETILFSGTVAENIRMGRPWISSQEVHQAAHAAGLGPDLEAWGTGLDTEVGIRGLLLSGGQRQRLALARALVGRPKILLLDSVTASLDASTEAQIWKALYRALPGCTTLVATHRPSTLQRAQHIVVLEDGRVVESGTFEALHRPETRFHAMYMRWKLERDLA